MSGGGSSVTHSSTLTATGHLQTELHAGIDRAVSKMDTDETAWSLATSPPDGRLGGRQHRPHRALIKTLDTNNDGFVDGKSSSRSPTEKPMGDSARRDLDLT